MLTLQFWEGDWQVREPFIPLGREGTGLCSICSAAVKTSYSSGDCVVFLLLPILAACEVNGVSVPTAWVLPSLGKINAYFCHLFFLQHCHFSNFMLFQKVTLGLFAPIYLAAFFTSYKKKRRTKANKPCFLLVHNLVPSVLTEKKYAAGIASVS